LNDVFERFMQIGDLIESPVVRHRQGPRQFGQLPRSLDVDSVLFRQDAKYDAVHTSFFGANDGALHLCELSTGIDEVSRAWPYHGKNRNAYLRPRCAHEISARCNTAERQITAEFDAVRAGRVLLPAPIQEPQH